MDFLYTQATGATEGGVRILTMSVRPGLQLLYKARHAWGEDDCPARDCKIPGQHVGMEEEAASHRASRATKARRLTLHTGMSSLASNPAKFLPEVMTRTEETRFSPMPLALVCRAGKVLGTLPTVPVRSKEQHGT